MAFSCRESALSFEAADGSELPLLLFEPVDGHPPRAGVVLFHGGGLKWGSADEMAAHCRRLAHSGILAASAGYRLVGNGADGIADCVADVRRAVAAFGKLAASRGLDASRLASGGSSAGAHLAVAAAMLRTDGTDGTDGTEWADVLGEPDGPEPALVALDLPGVDLAAMPPELRGRLEQEVGIAEGRALDYSLIEHVRPGLPRMLIQNGAADEVSPIDHIRRFRDAMVRAGNDCVLIEYANAEHAFHFGVDAFFDHATSAVVRFLGRE